MVLLPCQCHIVFLQVGPGSSRGCLFPGSTSCHKIAAMEGQGSACSVCACVCVVCVCVVCVCVVCVVCVCACVLTSGVCEKLHKAELDPRLFLHCSVGVRFLPGRLVPLMVTVPVPPGVSRKQAVNPCVLYCSR